MNVLKPLFHKAFLPQTKNKKEQMKYKITKEEFEALEENLQSEYTLEGESATIKLEEAPDFEGVQKKLEIEKEHRKNAEKAQKEAETMSTKLQKDLENAGGNKSEIERIQKEHTAELEKMRLERETEKKINTEKANKFLIDAEATKFANANFVESPFGNEYIKEKYASRLSVETVDGQQVIRVKDIDGKPSIHSVSDLQKEYLDNKAFSPIIKANVGGGSGASPNQQGSGAARKKLSEMSATEEAAFEKENPQEYAASIGNNA